MADISTYKDDIKTALTGAEIRGPLTKALNAINTQGRDAKTFSGKGIDHFAKRTDIAKFIPIDKYPIQGSTRLVTGGGIFSAIGDIENFDWGEDEWLT